MQESYRKTHGLCVLVDGSQGSREDRYGHSDENKLVFAMSKGLHHDTSSDFAHDDTSTSGDLCREDYCKTFGLKLLYFDMEAYRKPTSFDSLGGVESGNSLGP